MGSGFSGMLNHLTFGLFKNASAEKAERKPLDAAPGEEEETKIQKPVISVGNIDTNIEQEGNILTKHI